MYLFFNKKGSLAGTCSDSNSSFTVDGETCSTATKYDDYKDGHDYKFEDGEIDDLGLIEEANAND